MLDAIFEAVKAQALTFAGSNFLSIGHGALPEGGGLCMYPGPGYDEQVFLDRGRLRDVYFALNGKHADAKKLVHAMSEIHRGLSLADSYPGGDGWQVVGVETATPPNYIDREPSGAREWVYASLLLVKVDLNGGH